MRNPQQNSVVTLSCLMVVLAILVIACGPAATPTPKATTAPPTPTKAAAPTATSPVPTPTTSVAATPTPTRGPPTPTTTPAPAKLAFGQFNRSYQDLLGLDFPGVKPAFNLPPRRGGILKIAHSYPWPHFDTAFVTGGGVITPMAPTHNKLVSCKPGVEMTKFSVGTCEVGPDLAESWETSADGTVVTFHLRNGVKWQNLPPVNGRDLTADDIKYSFEYYQKSAAQAALFASVQKIETPDKSTVKVFLKGPNPDFLMETVAEVYVVIQPREVAEQDGDFKKTIVGTGPFQVKQIVGKEQIIYQRNPNYFLPGAPLLDGVEQYVVVDMASQRAMYRAGQVHMNTEQITRSEWGSILSSNPGTVVQQVEWDFGSWVIYLHTEKAPFNDVRVRRAMSLAIDRPGIIKDVYGGDGAVMAPLPWSYIFDKKPTLDQLPWYRHDPAEAKRLLAEAGYPNGFSFTAERRPLQELSTQQLPVVQDNLKAVGIEMKLNIRDNTAFTALQSNRKYDDALVGYALTRTSANGYYYQPLYSKSSGNWAGVNDPALDKILEASAVETDPAKRKALLKQVFDAETQQVWRMPLAWPKTAYYINSKLHNWVYSIVYIPPFKLGRTFEYMWLEQ